VVQLARTATRQERAFSIVGHSVWDSISSDLCSQDKFYLIEITMNQSLIVQKYTIKIKLIVTSPKITLSQQNLAKQTHDLLISKLESQTLNI